MTKRSLDPCIGALILHDGRVSVSLPKHFFFSLNKLTETMENSLS